jgi:hypothetical protein
VRSLAADGTVHTEVMRVTRRIERGDWLVDRSRSDATVGGIVGSGFDAYARILHPVPVQRIDPATLDDDEIPATVAEENWSWSRLADALGARMHPLVQWPRMVGNRDYFELTAELHVAPPTDGRLDPDSLAALVAHARAVTTTPDDVVAAMWAGWSIPGSGVRYASVAVGDTAEESDDDALDDPWAAQRRAVDPVLVDAMRAGPFLSYPTEGLGMEYVLLETTLAELSDPAWVYRAGLGWADGGDGLFPQFFWPEDHSWVIGTDIDFTFTIIGGTRRLVDAVLADDRFEAFEVHEGDDLSWAGDVINGDAHA